MPHRISKHSHHNNRVEDLGSVLPRIYEHLARGASHKQKPAALPLSPGGHRRKTISAHVLLMVPHISPSHFLFIQPLKEMK